VPHLFCCMSSLPIRRLVLLLACVRSRPSVAIGSQFYSMVPLPFTPALPPSLPTRYDDVHFSDGRRPPAAVGDFVAARPRGTDVVLKMYLNSPNERLTPVVLSIGSELGQWMGPVLDVEDGPRFVSVQVQHPRALDLRGWVNVWRRHDSGSTGANYAFIKRPQPGSVVLP